MKKIDGRSEYPSAQVHISETYITFLIAVGVPLYCL